MRFRSHDWWDFKLFPILQLFVATALMLRVPLMPLWPGLAMLLASLVSGAMFASLVNDLTDRESDRLAGKPNALDGWPTWLGIGLIAAALAAGGAVLWAWRHDAPLTAAYAGAWLAFAAYSVPPLRLKVRGGWGVVAVSAGEAALPSLVAVLAAFDAADRPIDAVWATAATAWAMCHGIRAILWHQIGDHGADARVNVGTFVVRHGGAAARLVGRFALPVELLALAVLLWGIGGALPWLALAAYLVSLRARMLFWQEVPVAVMPVPGHHLFLQEYYLGYLPFAMLGTALWRRDDAIALAIVLLPFLRAPLRALVDAGWLLRTAAGRTRRAILRHRPW